MSKRIMILHQGAEFMVDSLVTNLNKNDLDTVVVSAANDQPSDELDNCDAVILYSGDYLQNISLFLSKLRDFCFEKERPLFVIGYDKDIALANDYIPETVYAGKFIRPFDVKELIDRVIRIVNKAEDAPAEKRSILLVDDDAVFLKTMLKFLSGKFNVTAVRAGHHAIKYLDAHTPDLILLDYEMPVMSGPQTLEKIRSRPGTADIPVIFLTGISDKESVVTVMQMKPEGYLLKSMGRDEILASISSYFIARKWKKK